jgi:hypothetical protein
MGKERYNLATRLLINSLRRRFFSERLRDTTVERLNQAAHIRVTLVRN